jgi:hypothetical protein
MAAVREGALRRMAPELAEVVQEPRRDPRFPIDRDGRRGPWGRAHRDSLFHSAASELQRLGTRAIATEEPLEKSPILLRVSRSRPCDGPLTALREYT